jgi:hypothetical protein
MALEIKFAGNLLEHTSWRQVEETERIWRSSLQRNAVATVNATYKLGSELLTSGAAPNHVIRSLAYQALGKCRKSSGVPILYEWAVRKEKNHSHRIVICEALGNIGGISAVKALTQLATYKGYGASPMEKRDEYMAICSAFSALAKIASRADDNGAERAIKEIIKFAGDTRKLPNLPSIGEQALWYLQANLKSPSDSHSEKYWLNWRKKHLSLNADKYRIPIPENFE